MTDSPLKDAETRLQLLAGQHPNGQPVFEDVLATPVAEGHYRLLKSPLFVRGVASGDVIELKEGSRGRFTVSERSGQLSLRVFARNGLAELAGELTPAMEKLGGELDLQGERALVYSIHVAVGFAAIEKLLGQWVDGDNSAWNYGNVFDPDSGEPLNWWQSLLQP